MTTKRTSPTPVRTVAIVTRDGMPEAAAIVAEVAEWLAERGIRAVADAATGQSAPRARVQALAANEWPGRADLLVVLGGDGTLLGAARGAVQADTDIPVLAVNMGSLGFLTEITLPELYRALDSVIDGSARFVERQMLRGGVARNGQATADRLALNDVVISRGALSTIIEFSVTIGEDFVTRVRADGLIVASPTGSTAHNMAAGGPIVHPVVDALVLTPIAPHTLTNRPVVIPSTTPVHITANLEHNRSAYASFDGQSGLELAHGDVVTIRRAPRTLRVVRSEARDYFAVLREKLKWGQR